MTVEGIFGEQLHPPRRGSEAAAAPLSIIIQSVAPPLRANFGSATRGGIWNFYEIVDLPAPPQRRNSFKSHSEQSDLRFVRGKTIPLPSNEYEFQSAQNGIRISRLGAICIESGAWSDGINCRHQPPACLGFREASLA